MSSTEQQYGTDNQQKQYEQSFRGLDIKDLAKEVQDLKTELKVQQATQAGESATMAATQAGQASTVAAAQAGTWVTLGVGGAALAIGMFLAAAVINAARSR